MADDMKRVGLSFKTDGTVDFQKSLKQISEAVQGNRQHDGHGEADRQTEVFAEAD